MTEFRKRKDDGRIFPIGASKEHRVKDDYEPDYNETAKKYPYKSPDQKQLEKSKQNAGMHKEDITVHEAKELKYGTELYHKKYRNSDGTPQRWKVKGKPKTWKRNPERVRIPLKRGLYEYDYLTEHNIDDFSSTEEGAMK